MAGSDHHTILDTSLRTGCATELMFPSVSGGARVEAIGVINCVEKRANEGM